MRMKHTSQTGHCELHYIVNLKVTMFFVGVFIHLFICCFHENQMNISVTGTF
jgi:hypothetical protein